MGVVQTSPSVPRRDGEGAFKTRRRARVDRLERARARGSKHGYTSWGAPNARSTSHARVTEAGWNITDAGGNKYLAHW
jgi:hypothetical protein